MKNLSYLSIFLIIFSCTEDRISPQENSQSNSIVDPGKSKGSNARTTCQICISNYPLPVCPNTKDYFGSYGGVGSYFYPRVTIPICDYTKSVGILVRSEAIPNKFTITYVYRNGTQTQWISPWMGIMDFPGPWGAWGPTVIGPSILTAPLVTTTAQTTWLCPWALPNSSRVLEYTNTSGTSPNGVTWSIQNNNPSGSTTLSGNGQTFQSINFLSNFSSATLRATSNGSSGGFLDCVTEITITAPIVSNVVAVWLDVWTSNPGPSYPRNPNQDAWSARVTLDNNTNTTCPSCF